MDEKKQMEEKWIDLLLNLVKEKDKEPKKDKAKSK